MNSITTIDNESALAAAVSKMAADGFVLLPQLCSNELVALVRDVSQRRSQQIRDALGSREIGIGSAAGYDEIVQRSPGRWDVPITLDQFGVDDEKLPWRPLIAAILGEDAQHSFSGVVSSDPGSPAQYWHADSPHIASDHLEAHALNVMVALHDIPMTMGPTECARGSHFLTNHLNNPSLVVNELIYQHEGTSSESLVNGTPHKALEIWSSPMPAGSCLIFDDRLLHRGLANQSESTRHVAYFSYRRKSYSDNTHFESQRSVFDPVA